MASHEPNVRPDESGGGLIGALAKAGSESHDISPMNKLGLGSTLSDMTTTVSASWTPKVIFGAFEVGGGLEASDWGKP